MNIWETNPFAVSGEKKLKNRRCKIPYMHDFDDMPCKICSPKDWKNKRNGEIIDWSLVVLTGLMMGTIIYLCL